MRCKSNCCNEKCSNQNRCCENGGDFLPTDKCFEPMVPQGHQCMSQCDVFTALSTTAQTVTGAEVTPLTISNILYQYGSSIQTKTGDSSIYIKKPGLYQISYAIVATNTDIGTAATSTFTSYLLCDNAQVATATATIAPGGSGTLSDTELFYVSCQDLPLTLSLNITSTAAASSYVFAITINRICSCGNEQ